MSEISTEPLEKAIARFEESLTAYRARPDDLMVRDSVIKRFEFTFELSQSLLRKFVVALSVNLKEREELTFPTMIRTASQDGVLLHGNDVWKRYREARNRTSMRTTKIRRWKSWRLCRRFWRRRNTCTGG